MCIVDLHMYMSRYPRQPLAPLICTSAYYNAPTNWYQMRKLLWISIPQYPLHLAVRLNYWMNLEMF